MGNSIKAWSGGMPETGIGVDIIPERIDRFKVFYENPCDENMLEAISKSPK